jgi:type III secretion protein J
MVLPYFYRLLCLVSIVLFLCGCNHSDLYTGVTEHQANEMVALLQTAGIPAQKEPREAGVYALTTSQENFGSAIALLQANGLPRGSFDNVGQVFKKEGFVSSPTEERARLTYALSQELAGTLQNIDGVIVARVHLAVPEKDPLLDKPKPASASVFIKHRPGRDLGSQVGQMKALLVNGVEGLPYDNVTVALFPAEMPSPTTVPARSGLNGPLRGVAGAAGIAGIAVASGVGLVLLVWGVWMWWRNRSKPVLSANQLVVVHEH